MNLPVTYRVMALVQTIATHIRYLEQFTIQVDFHAIRGAQQIYGSATVCNDGFRLTHLQIADVGLGNFKIIGFQLDDHRFRSIREGRASAQHDEQKRQRKAAYFGFHIEISWKK
jgi:hypothetical protein